MTADPRTAAAGLLLDRWPHVLLVATMLTLILAGPRLTRWWPAYERRRDRPRPSIDQASHDRAPAVQPPQEET